MKCSLKDGLINIFLIIFIVPSKGIEIPLLLQTSSVLDKPMNFKQFKAAINKLQDLDSFPNAGDSKNKLHKIVKKQMATSDSKDLKKNKRSVLSTFNLPESFDQSVDDGSLIMNKDDGKMKKAANGFELTKSSQNNKNNQLQDKEIPKEFLGKLKDFAKNKQMLFSNQKNKKLSIKEKEKKCNLYGSFLKGTENPDSVDVKAKEKKLREKRHSAQKTEKKLQGKEKEDAKLETGSLIIQEKPYAKPAIKGRQKYTQSAEKGKQTPAKQTTAQDLEITSQRNAFLRHKCTRIPDRNDFRCYYECEAKPFGCMKLKHKRCPDGQFFSYKYLKCLKAESRKIKIIKKRAGSPYPKKIDVFDTSEDPEPANEWLDANQGPIQKIPPEFKPKKIPGLKIYHLCSKRNMNEILPKKSKKRHASGNFQSPCIETQRNLGDVTKSMAKRLGKRQHHPRSFLIRIKKKEGKENQDQSITENDEDEEESDEEDDEEDGEDEDEETEDEIQENPEEEEEEEKPSHKDGLKELFKSAKAAVTNKARFDDPTRLDPGTRGKGISSLKSKKSEVSNNSEAKNKKVLVDANIRVDSTIGNILKYILKSKAKSNKDSQVSLVANDEALICDRGSQDQMDPELLRMYEHLIRNNPRVKRYFLANNVTKGN